jgi:hypothetical protein
VQDLLAGVQNLSHPSQFFIAPAGKAIEAASRHPVVKLQPCAQHGVKAQNRTQRFETNRERSARQDQAMTLIEVLSQTVVCVASERAG